MDSASMTSPAEDYYQVLGLEHGARDQDIRMAYLRLAAIWHPDKNKAPEANERFLEVAEAYRVLSDPEKRAIYDEHGKEGLAGVIIREQPMSEEQAKEQFWDAFRITTYKTGDAPSGRHGAYAATVGVVAAPLKGITLFFVLCGNGLHYAAHSTVNGFAEGSKDVAIGFQVLGGGRDALEDKDKVPEGSGVEIIAHGLSRPIVGVVSGAVVLATSALTGAAYGIAGGVAGATSNVRLGVKEMRDAARGTHQPIAQGSCLLELEREQVPYAIADAPMAVV